MSKKEDLRIVKTKASLYRGLLQIMREKPFEQIKVSEICAASYINRSTFYDHFNDKFELLQAMLDDLGNELKKSIVDNNSGSNYKDYYKEIITIVMRHLDENKEVYSQVVKSNCNSIARDMIMQTVINTTTKNVDAYGINKHNVPTKIFVTFYAAGFINVMFESLKDLTTFNPDYLIEVLTDFIK